MTLVWLVTGTSTGLGRALTEAALKRGDKVIATARGRSISQVNDLKAKGADVLELDVTAPLDELKAVAKKAEAIHGRVDVLVNNAGYISLGALEELTPEETLDQFNVNLFGALNVTRAFLPYMRKRKSGTVIFIGSLAGYQTNPTVSLYCASKAATKPIAEALHVEIGGLGLRATHIDFGYFRTDFLKPGHRSTHNPRIPDYTPITSMVDGGLSQANGHQPGDPVKGVNVLIDIVKGEGVAKGKEWPAKGVILGSDTYKVVTDEAEALSKNLAEWKDVTTSTDITA